MLDVQQIILRCVKEEDLESIHPYLHSVWPSLQQLRLAFFETGLWSAKLGMQLLEKDLEPIGAIWYEKDKTFDALSLRFVIFREEDRGHGWMKDALKGFCKTLFLQKKIERLQILVPDYSKAAIRVAQGAQFQFEGIVRKGCFLEGRYKDVCIYSLLRDNLA